MYAGVEGRGAEDAAYVALLLAEWCNLTKTNFTGGSADIFKCFDQIVRPLLREVMEQAGTKIFARTGVSWFYPRGQDNQKPWSVKRPHG